MPSPSTAEIQLKLLESVLAAVRAGVLVFDAEQRVVFWNSWMEQHARISAAQAHGKCFVELFPEMAGSRTHTAIEAALNNNFASLISQTLNKSPFPLYPTAAADAADGARMQQAVHVVPLHVAGLPRHCMVQISDVSMASARERKLREMTVELESQTLVDGLTGIANRRHFDLHLEDEFRRAKRNLAPLSLIMLDVDNFKAYNDNYGHQRGDICLVKIATTLHGMLHRSRDLAARYGGEEFAMTLPDTNAEGALRVAHAMRAAVEALALPHDYSGVAPWVTVSIGVATQLPQSTAQSSDLLQAADQALYQAKHAGRNRVATPTDAASSQ